MDNARGRSRRLAVVRPTLCLVVVPPLILAMHRGRARSNVTSVSTGRKNGGR